MQVSELAEEMVRHFETIERRFNAFERRLDVTDRHSEERFDAIDRNVAELQDTVRGIYENLDTYSRRADAYFHEMAMLGSQVSRHGRWIGELAERADVELGS